MLSRVSEATLLYHFEDFSLDGERRELSRNGAAVAVEPKVLDLLRHIVANRDRVVSREELIAAIWQGRIVSESAIATCINAARSALEDSGDQQRLIRTFPRRGVRFMGAVRPQPHGSVPALVPAFGPALLLPEKPSIAVLPFQNMSSDPEQEYFADGMVDDIIMGLARIKWLFVISRNSSFAFKNSPTITKHIGQQLGVRYLLEGSVRKSGMRVRIGAQLIDAESGAHIWADRYDRQLEDVFALQDEISARVVGAIEPNIRSAELDRIRRTRPSNLQAYDLVLRAQPYALSHIAEEAAQAIPLLTQAIALEPDYASAHAPLALCYHSRFSRAGLREDDRASAIGHAHAAIASGGDDASALGIAGFVIALDAHDYATAIKAFDHALSISSSNFFALSSSALALSWMGTADVAIERAERALRVSPFDPMNFMSYNALAISHLHKQQFDQAHEAAKCSVAVSPRFSVSRAFLTAALSQLGRHDEAYEQAQQVLQLDPGFSVHRFSVTVDIEPSVFAPIAAAWRKSGLP